MTLQEIPCADYQRNKEPRLCPAFSFALLSWTPPPHGHKLACLFSGIYYECLVFSLIEQKKEKDSRLLLIRKQFVFQFTLSQASTFTFQYWRLKSGIPVC